MSQNYSMLGARFGWRQQGGEASLAEVNASIAIAPGWSLWRKMVAFVGPGYLVAVGYMDPGNWATSLSAGARFGYSLLAVTLLSSLMGILLQALCLRLGIVTGRDLAQSCRDAFPRFLSFPLWIAAELAICATDLAEVIGTAIGLKLLFGLPLEIGVVLTALDVLLILALQRLGFRYVEAFVIALLLVIAGCFLAQIALARPDWQALVSGFVPSSTIITDSTQLYLALGIIGATVMPHNLFLHSAIVQTRAYGKSDDDKREAIKLASVDSSLALFFAFFVNAAILVLAAAAFNASGRVDVAELDQAHALLSPLLGATIAPALFAVALLCCGLNSTVTATLAGQVVMEGFLNLRLAPWLRRLVTRLIAIVPAIIVTFLYGESGTGQLLIFSQVVLSLQLPFAVIPLVMFTAERRKMGTLVAPRWMTGLAALIAVIVSVLNIKLVYDVVSAAFA